MTSSFNFVLVLDSNPHFCLGLEILLKKQGIQTYTMTPGPTLPPVQELIDYLNHNHPDLFLCEHQIFQAYSPQDQQLLESQQIPLILIAAAEETAPGARLRKPLNVGTFFQELLNLF